MELSVLWKLKLRKAFQQQAEHERYKQNTIVGLRAPERLLPNGLLLTGH